MFGGIVIKGEGIGRQYGYPTANLNCLKKEVKISEGIYACYVYVRKKKYPAALAVQSDPWKVEVHIFDFNEDLYGSFIEVDLVQKVSEFEMYTNTKELIEKIGRDVQMVKDLLGV
ncbi:MAG: riboflavin kinase [Candidatus Magasanikbacteria bacterium]|nr:riboflavin kinase [Candidatus Magasanikbacteria bacterium]